MIKWKRPSGNMIETNDTDASIEYAVSNDWEQADKPKPKKASKKAATNDNSATDN